MEHNTDDQGSEFKSKSNAEENKRQAGSDKNDTEYSSDFTADDLLKTNTFWHVKKNKNIHSANEIHALPETIKVLIVISWICAALAGFVSVYFAILGIISAYAANRAAPGAGRSALITNVILAILNLILSFAFLQTVRNIFALI